MKVILIHGFKRSGKDTIADLIIELAIEKNKKAIKKALADPIKDILTKTLDLTRDELEYIKEHRIEFRYVVDENMVKKKMQGRDLLKNFGQEMKKYFGVTVWSDIILNEIRFSNADIFIVPDIRFYGEEFFYLKTKLERELYDIVTIKVKGGSADKNFEKEIDDNEFDLILDNSKKDKKDLEKFKKQLKELI